AFLFLVGRAIEGRRERASASVVSVSVVSASDSESGSSSAASGSPAGVSMPVCVGVPALLAVGLLVNPYGWRLIEVPVGIARALEGLSAHNPEWMSSFEAPQPYLFGGFAVV